MERQSPKAVDWLAGLKQRLSAPPAAALAFSGGVDSTLLLALLRDTLGADHVLALTAVTPYMVRQEIGDAVATASEFGVRHELVEIPMAAGLENNPPDRCYRCKQGMYGRLLERAAELGFQTLYDASNKDDLEDYRPGLTATRELGVASPFIESGLGKAAIRELSRALGLRTWQKPTNACLLTRLRMDDRVSMERLQQVEEAERALLARGFSWVRVRLHGDLARIEVAAVERASLLEQAEAVSAELRALGLRYVTMDLVGYQLGSMNEPRQ